VPSCPFCTLDPDRVHIETDDAIAFRDRYPISPGHTLVIPRLHSASLFDLPQRVQGAVWEMVAQVRTALSQEFQLGGFNIGLNDGIAAGQTVMHAHIHVIPRYTSDVPDPRGGVRCVIPEKANYWSKP
jgi:diadenosine tetraphosphate (Ap4A) HIT family hydrolase